MMHSKTVLQINCILVS